MPSSNIATNIRLPEEILTALKYRALEEKKSVNRLVREAIERYLFPAPQPVKRGKDPFEDVIGIAKSGTRDGSKNHDRYLYGKGK